MLLEEPPPPLDGEEELVDVPGPLVLELAPVAPLWARWASRWAKTEIAEFMKLLQISAGIVPPSTGDPPYSVRMGLSRLG